VLTTTKTTNEARQKNEDKLENRDLFFFWVLTLKFHLENENLVNAA